MNEDIKKDIDNINDELDIDDLDNVNGGAIKGPLDPHHR